MKLELSDGADPDVALAQVARMISLDQDGHEFMRVGDLGELQARHPRPFRTWTTVLIRVAGDRAFGPAR